MDRLDRMDRRARYSLGAAVAFVGVLLLVLGWYLVSGEAIAAKQLPYLASASLPGAALLVCGWLFMISGPSGTDLETARKVAELHALLTEAVGTETSEGGTTALLPAAAEAETGGSGEAVISPPHLASSASPESIATGTEPDTGPDPDVNPTADPPAGRADG